MFNAYAKRHSQRPNLGWTLGDPVLPLSPGDWAAMAGLSGHVTVLPSSVYVCLCPAFSGRCASSGGIGWHLGACSLYRVCVLFPTRAFNPRPFTKAPGCPVLPRSVLRKQRGPSPMGLLGDWLGGGFQERTIQARTEEAEGPREHPGDSPALCGGRVRNPLETET